MKRFASVSAIVFTFLLLMLIVDAARADRRYSLPGKFDKKNKTCTCPNSANTCRCIIDLEPPRMPIAPFPESTGIYASSPYRRLVRLDSFVGEDEDFLYFRAAVSYEGDRPIFDITAPGNVLVKISRRLLAETLISE